MRLHVLEMCARAFQLSCWTRSLFFAECTRLHVLEFARVPFICWTRSLLSLFFTVCMRLISLVILGRRAQIKCWGPHPRIRGQRKLNQARGCIRSQQEQHQALQLLP